MKFSRSTWSTVAVALSTITMVRGDTGIPDTLEGYNITEQVLGVAAAISQPTCNATEPCITLVTSTIPRCESLHNDPGCWCGNHDPVHYCAQCMSNPTDNSTNADQMEQSVSFHRGYHIYCADYAKILNGTEANPANQNSGGGSKSKAGPIAGGVVGGLAVVALITFGVWFFMKKRAKRRMSPSAEYMSQQNTGAGPLNAGGSVFSSSNGGGSKYGGSSTPGSPAPMGMAYNAPTPASFNPYAPPPSGSPAISNNGAHPMSPGSQYGGSTAGSRNSQVLGYDTSMLAHLSPPPQNGYFPPVAEQMEYNHTGNNK